MKRSNFLRINLLDVARAFLLAFIALVLNFAQEIFIPAMNVSPELKVFLLTAIGYLIKNFFTKPAV